MTDFSKQLDLTNTFIKTIPTSGQFKLGSYQAFMKNLDQKLPEAKTNLGEVLSTNSPLSEDNDGTLS